MDLGLRWGNCFELSPLLSHVSSPRVILSDHDLYRFLIYSPSIRNTILRIVQEISFYPGQRIFIHHTVLLIPFCFDSSTSDGEFLIQLRDRLLIGPPFSPFPPFPR